MSPETSDDFETLLRYLKHTRGFDFGAYKPSTLARRVQRRIEILGKKSYAGYIEYLEEHPDEFTHLFNTILINVTAFFRDPPAWEYLVSDVIPRIVASKKLDDPIRVWDTGCASGEETYTLVMVLAETLGREQLLQRVKIYATDVDEEALAQSRQATYSAKGVEGIPPTLLAKYFEPGGPPYVFRTDLRRTLVFGRNNLIEDPPISRVDLLVCRNTLMYFTPEVQKKIVDRFAFALNDHGFLFLGRAEMMVTHTDAFMPVETKWRFFTKVRHPEPNRWRLGAATEPAGAGREPASNAGALGNSRTPNNDSERHQIKEIVFETGSVGQIVLDPSGELSMANNRAMTLFGLSTTDLHRPWEELRLTHRPEELGPLVAQAIAKNHPVGRRGIEWPTAEGARHFNIEVQPLLDAAGTLMAVSVTLVDVTPYQNLKDELIRATTEWQTAQEELQSSNEELETTNEELQSAAEELETTNEELQSTNEELETMNEELQSTNAEVQAASETLRERGNELDRLNIYLQSILGGLRSGVVVVDRELHVQIWNKRAEDLWGLRADEVEGKHFFNLDIGLPVDKLKQSLRAILSGEADFKETSVEARNRRGKSIVCKVMVTPMRQRDNVIGVILLMEEFERTKPSRKSLR